MYSVFKFKIKVLLHINLFLIFSSFNLFSQPVKSDISSQDKTFGMMQNDESIDKKSTKKLKNTSLVIPKNYSSIKNADVNLEKIDFPIIYELELFVDDLYNLDLKNNFFFSKLYLAAYTEYDSIGITDKNLIFSTMPGDNFNLKYEIGDASFISKWNYQGYINDSLYNKYSYISEVENNFFHDWNLNDYPFDNQKLKIEFISNKDTSEINLKASENFPPRFNSTISDLKDGYNIKGITSEISYYESPFDNISTDGDGNSRKKIFSRLTFNIEVDRSGSWLFLKLFLGTFLSFFISWIVFLIPVKEFESRISLSVGAIFGAIGNRYFVDSTMPNVQVLTKADLLNNIVLILLVFNIVVVVIQENKKFNYPLLENKNNAMKISLFTLLASIIIIYIF